MAKTSLREAVKHFDVTKPTLLKALQSGKVSGEKDERGVWQIDHSELLRVYHPRSPAPGKVDGVKGGDLTGEKSPLSPEYTRPVKALPGEAQVELEALRAKLAAAEARADAAERVAEVMGQLAAERLDRIEDLRRMLPAPEPSSAPEPPTPTPNDRGGWWPFRRR